MTEFKDGLYLKRSGHFALVYSDQKDGREIICVAEGKTQPHPFLRGRVNYVIQSNNRELAWGPTAFMKTAEYVGEL